ncbi:molybdate ABC transporter substrate-binding protein [Devosia limi DSM 17137]|uniref:Molybdate ABC transporter substrate-binding protein n=1 Tax=Devosia limi DSM 17137 TaxID=1121477 RepID=A0A0F5LU53_9HYPH|nr:molybdate ABC transporter substrate-binding protein [Devosia limi]KKB85679.1 molybdate ABC transporter substrate-binding protein [Devosia limi DSM 17137]SHE43446.1 molybdate transport system substrate-binding protein [Devosia limi DSM 17137]
MERAVLASVLLGLLLVQQAHAGSASVAVAANFTAVAEELAPLFKAETGHDVTYSFGATGQLYAQISQGAPFEVFLAADDERPPKAVADGFGVDGTVFTYAIGALALYSTVLEVTDGKAALEGPFDKIAIADPATAPYGRAAVEALAAMGLHEAITPKLVTGENISQTLQFVESGNAELGFVAASQVIGKDSVWIVPADLYEPIRQDAVLLRTGAENPVALSYVEFLKGDKARAVITAAGYVVE